MTSKNYVRNCIEKGEVCPKLISNYEELKSVVAKIKSLSYEGAEDAVYQEVKDNEGDDDYMTCDEICDEDIEREFYWTYINLLCDRNNSVKKLSRVCTKCGGQNKLITKLILEAEMELTKKAFMQAERAYMKAERTL